MHYAFAGAQLAATFSMKLNIAWPRLIVSLVILGCMIIAAAYLEQKARPGKK
jgi:hypothetical protein